ncbi:unnamed protein product [Gordionus sp. m RMFG-2023]
MRNKRIIVSIVKIQSHLDATGQIFLSEMMNNSPAEASLNIMGAMEEPEMIGYLSTLVYLSPSYLFKAFDLYENEKEVLKIATYQPFLVGYHVCFQTPNNYIIAMDYACGGDLDNLIKYLGRIPEESAKFYVAEMVLGVSFLHSKGIIHRDLKPENVMLDQDSHIRITDYGLCKRDFSYGEKIKERVGTLDYVAPEIWLGKSYDFRVDIWALGVTMYKMLTGRKPFDLPLKRNPWQRLIGKKAIVRIPDSISDEACQVLQKFLAKKMKNRLGSNPSTTIHSIASLRFFSSIDWKLLEARRVQPPYKPILPP